VSYWGRKQELKTLETLKEKNTASLVVVMGRRRIGKSSLAKSFGETYHDKLFFEGLAPNKKQNNKTQLSEFANQLTRQTGLAGFQFEDWSDALIALAKLTEKKKILILLDEISWMGAHDTDFPGKLKIVWDNYFSKNKNLILIICGSVSSWISENMNLLIPVG
jgi:AAA+ ATPase superfamily predicted ATPase